MVDFYVQPEADPAPLEGAALLDFVQEWVVGVTGMDGRTVRPRVQPEPPNIPQSGTTWASIGITDRPSDDFPFVGFDGDVYSMQRQETLTVLCSFYDLGDTGLADKLCAILRDGAIIGPNRTKLTSAGMNLVNTTAPVAVPVLVKSRWQYRVDMTVVLRRQIDRVYPVPAIAATSVIIRTDTQIVDGVGYHVEVEIPAAE